MTMSGGSEPGRKHWTKRAIESLKNRKLEIFFGCRHLPLACLRGLDDLSTETSRDPEADMGPRKSDARLSGRSGTPRTKGQLRGT